MESLFGLMQVALVCFTLFGIAFIVLLAMPQSHMRDVAKNAMLAILCAIYVLSPVDLLPEVALGPFGLIDDLGALVAGINAARNAMKPAA